MKSVRIIFLVLVVSSAILVNYDLSRRPKNFFKDATANPATLTVPSIKSDELRQAELLKQQSEAKSFVVSFKKEVSELTKLQNDPQKYEKRLNKFATKLNQQNVDELYDIISNDRNAAEQRSLAVEMLSVKNDTASLTALQNFVGNKTTVNGTKWNTKKELETVLRAQAVESIASYPQKDIALSTLNFLLHRVDDKFLSERIGRAAINLNTRNQNSEQQGDTSLKSLIE